VGCIGGLVSNIAERDSWCAPITAIIGDDDIYLFPMGECCVYTTHYYSSQGIEMVGTAVPLPRNAGSRYIRSVRHKIRTNSILES